MAGTYGLNAKNMPVSAAAGKPMLDELARPDTYLGRPSAPHAGCRCNRGPANDLSIRFNILPWRTG